jgi:hypothetical protein
LVTSVGYHGQAGAGGGDQLAGLVARVSVPGGMVHPQHRQRAQHTPDTELGLVQRVLALGAAQTSVSSPLKFLRHRGRSSPLLQPPLPQLPDLAEVGPARRRHRDRAEHPRLAKLDTPPT